MPSTGDDGSLFDEALVEAVANAHGVDEAALAALVDRHQSSVEALPGVENLVYEWRRHYEEPVVEQTDGAYYLSVPEWVWDEFGDHLDVGERPLDALVEVHCRTVADRTDGSADPPGNRTYVALDRELDAESAEDPE